MDASDPSRVRVYAWVCAYLICACFMCASSILLADGVKGLSRSEIDMRSGHGNLEGRTLSYSLTHIVQGQ